MAEKRQARTKADAQRGWIQIVPNHSGESPRFGVMVAGEPLTHDNGKEMTQDDLRVLAAVIEAEGSEFLEVVVLPEPPAPVEPPAAEAEAEA